MSHDDELDDDALESAAGGMARMGHSTMAECPQCGRGMPTSQLDKHLAHAHRGSS